MAFVREIGRNGVLKKIFEIQILIDTYPKTIFVD